MNTTSSTEEFVNNVKLAIEEISDYDVNYETCGDGFLNVNYDEYNGIISADTICPIDYAISSGSYPAYAQNLIERHQDNFDEWFRDEFGDDISFDCSNESHIEFEQSFNEQSGYFIYSVGYDLNNEEVFAACQYFDDGGSYRTMNLRKVCFEVNFGADWDDIRDEMKKALSEL